MTRQITVKDSRGLAFTETYPIAVEKDITGAEVLAFEYGKSSSKAVKVYLAEQTAAIQHLLTDINHALLTRPLNI